MPDVSEDRTSIPESSKTAPPESSNSPAQAQTGQKISEISKAVKFLLQYKSALSKQKEHSGRTQGSWDHRAASSHTTSSKQW